jgi:hypothetical protein
MNDVSESIRENLKLDVPWIDQVFLDVQRVVAESRPHLRLGHGELFAQRILVLTDANATAASAGRRLDHHRIADSEGEGGRLVDRRHRTGARRNDRHPGLFDDPLGLDLVACQIQVLRSRADEDQAGVFTGSGKSPVFGQIAVTGMDRPGTRLSRRFDDGIDVQVAPGADGRSDADALVGMTDVQAILVGLGVDGHADHAELSCGAHDSEGDLAPIGDQYLARHRFDLSLDHPVSMTNIRSPSATATSLSTAISEILPAAGDLIF